MGANVQISVNLDAVKASIDSARVAANLLEAEINGNRVQVGNPQQMQASVQEAIRFNEVMKSILISVERLNISLAKTAKLNQQNTKQWSDNVKGWTKQGKGKGALFLPEGQAEDQWDAIIKQSEQAIQTIQKGLVPTINSVPPAVQQTTQETKKAGDEAEKAGKKAKKAGDQAAAGANVGKQGWKAFSDALRGKFKGAESFVGSFFSWFTVVLLAFEAVVKTFTYFWDNLTESIQKMTTRAQTAIKATQRKQKAIQQETKAAQDLVKQLEELNKEQNLSIDQQRLAEAIIARLNKQYKDLGITLDQTTGKYKGLYQAQRVIDERNRNSQVDALKKQINAQRDLVNASLANTFGRGINLDKDIYGGDFFTLAEKLGKTLGAENADLLARKWNTHDLEKQLEVIDQLIQGLSSSDQVIKNGPEAREALANLIDYRKQLQELNSVETLIVDTNKRLEDSFKSQRDAIKATKEQIANLNKSYENQQRANSLAELDPEDRANALRAEIEQLEKRNQSLKEAQQLGQKQLDKKMADSFDHPIELDSIEIQLKEYESTIEQYKKDLADLQQKRVGLQNKVDNFEVHAGVRDPQILNEQLATKKKLEADVAANLEKQKEVQSKLVEKQKELTALKEKYGEVEKAYQSSTDSILQYEQAISDLEKQRAQNMNQIQAKSQQIAEIEKQIEEARRAAAEAEQQRIDNYNQYVIGLYRKQQQSLNQILGLKKQNLLLETKLNAEKILGRQLTEKELQSLKNYVQINSMIGQFKQGAKLNIGGQQVITNDLARKGGWASSVVVDRAQDINKEILNVQKSQVSLMQKINDTMSKSNDLLKQFSVIQ